MMRVETAKRSEQAKASSVIALDYAQPPRPKTTSFLTLLSLLTTACFVALLLLENAAWASATPTTARGAAPVFTPMNDAIRLFLRYYVGELAAVGPVAVKALLWGAGLGCGIHALRPWRRPGADEAPTLVYGGGRAGLAVEKALILHRHGQRSRLR